LSYRSDNSGEESLVDIPGYSYLPSSNLRPSERHQIMEDLVKFQKELASEIYITRCREKDL